MNDGRSYIDQYNPNNEQRKLLINLGAGKVDLNRFDNYQHVIHVDRSFNSSMLLDDVLDFIYNNRPCIPTYKKTTLISNNNYETRHYCIKSDIYDFLDKLNVKVDFVNAERIFEHQEYCGGEIGRLLESINMITTHEAYLNIVVPNAILISKMLLDYEENHNQYHHTESINKKLLINSEFCNIKIDCHASVWSPILAKEYIESEGTWKIDKIENQIRYAGRNIYMRILCSKT